MNNCIAEPTSRFKIRKIVQFVRNSLGLTDFVFVPIVELLDVLTVVCDFNYEIVPNNSLPKQIFATTDVSTRTIKIKEAIYNKAIRGDGFARFTIAHELGHFFMFCVFGFSFAENPSGEPVPAYRDPEWQANCFAGEFLMPYNLVKNYSVNELMKKCCVSRSAAYKQYHAFKGR